MRQKSEDEDQKETTNWISNGINSLFTKFLCVARLIAFQKIVFDVNWDSEHNIRVLNDETNKDRNGK